MLEILGISIVEERIYTAVIDFPEEPLGPFAARLGLSKTEVRNSLESLEAKGLANRVPGRRDRWRPAPVQTASEALLAKAQERLSSARQEIERLRDRYRISAESQVASAHVEIALGLDGVRQRFAQFQQLAEREILGFDRPPYEATRILPETANPIESERLRKGIRYRIVYDRSALDVPGLLDAVTLQAESGEEPRVFDGLPTKLAIADRRIALMPLSLEEGGLDGVLVVRSPSIVTVLAEYFEMVWERAIPLLLHADPSVPATRGTAGLSKRDQQVLGLLITGLDKRAVARQLRISARTLDRSMQRVMGALGARTWFQAGWLLSKEAKS